MRFKILIIASLIFAVCGAANAANTYIVAPSGGNYTTFAAMIAAITLTGDDVVIAQAATPGGSATFDERFTPDGSGTAGHPIIVRTRPGDTITLSGINGGARGYIWVTGFTFSNYGSLVWDNEAITMAGCTGWYVYDNRFVNLGSSAAAVHGTFATTNDGNIFRNNYMDLPLGAGSTSLGNMFNMRGDNNVIDYNVFLKGGDRVADYGDGNIIRNNYSGPMLPADLPAVDPHVDFHQGVSSSKGANAINERNFVNQNDTDNAHFFLTTQSAGNYFINRFNVVTKVGADWSQFGKIPGVRAYNNTIIDEWNQQVPENSYSVVLTGAETVDSFFRNNSFTRSAILGTTESYRVVSSAANPDADYSHFYQYGATAFGSNNLTGVDPLFTNEATLDFTLQSGSPLRASGGQLTQTNGTGSSSTTLVVDDATGLSDGRGLVDGDWIRVGGGPLVQIASISGNTITLATADTWLDNEAVIAEGMEDRGALPWGSVPTVTGTMTNVSTTYTVTTTGDVRMVIFKENGVPQTPDYTAPYTHTTSSGNVTADVFSKWASMTPVVEATVVVHERGLSGTASLKGGATVK